MCFHPAFMLGGQGHCDGAVAAQRSEHNGSDCHGWKNADSPALAEDPEDEIQEMMIASVGTVDLLQNSQSLHKWSGAAALPANTTAISRTVLLLCISSRPHRQIGEE
jgi:hypothetical protein